MVHYSRSGIKKVSGSFIIETFHRKRKQKSEEKFRLIDAMDLGVYIVVPLLVGLGAGIVLDHVILGLSLGAIGSFFNLIKIVREYSKHA